MTQRVKAAGYHMFKAGLDVELRDVRLDSAATPAARAGAARRTPRPARRAAGSSASSCAFVRNLTPDEVADPDSVTLGRRPGSCAPNDRAICERAPTRSRANTDNRNLGAFIQDSWQIRPNLTLNVGLRWEQQIGYVAEALQGEICAGGRDRSPTRRTSSTNLLAPRLGFIYDPTTEGKSKLFGHYGRFYENVPMDLNVRAFGGEIHELHERQPEPPHAGAGWLRPELRRRPHAGTTGDAICRSDLDSATDTAQQALLGGGFEYVSPGLKGQCTRRAHPRRRVRVHGRLQGRRRTTSTASLPIVIEDISTDGGNTYLITNPGENFDGEAAKLRDARRMRLMASTDPQDSRRSARSTTTRAEQLDYVKQLRQADPQLRRPPAHGDAAPDEAVAAPGVVHVLACRRVTTRVCSRRRPASSTRT